MVTLFFFFGCRLVSQSFKQKLRIDMSTSLKTQFVHVFAICACTLSGTFAHFYPLMRLFRSLSICLMLFSGVGRSSGMVPPSSAMVCLTFLPTS